MRTLVIWRNLNKDTYYYKFISGTYKKYEVGYINQYNHQVILIIESEEFQPIINKQYVSLRKMVLTPVIAFLQKLNK